MSLLKLFCNVVSYGFKVIKNYGLELTHRKAGSRTQTGVRRRGFRRRGRATGRRPNWR